MSLCDVRPAPRVYVLYRVSGACGAGLARRRGGRGHGPRARRVASRAYSPWSPGYHPCSALGFPRRRPREGDDQGRTSRRGISSASSPLARRGVHSMIDPARVCSRVAGVSCYTRCRKKELPSRLRRQQRYLTHRLLRLKCCVGSSRASSYSVDSSLVCVCGSLLLRPAWAWRRHTRRSSTRRTPSRSWPRRPPRRRR